MATTPVQVYHDLEGFTSPTLYVLDIDGTSVLNGSGDVLTQSSGGKTVWGADVTEAIAGVYPYEVRVGSVAVAWGYILLADTTALHHGVLSYAEAQGLVNAAALAAAVEAVNTKLVTNYVAVISHQRPSGKIVIVRGDDYLAENEHYLSWVNADGSGWPSNLAGEELAVNFAAVHIDYFGTPTADVPDTHKIIATGTVHQATTPNQEIRVELTAEQTDVEEGLYHYDVEIVADDVTTTLVTTAKPDLTDPQFTTAQTQDDKLEVLPHFAQPTPDPEP